VDITPDYSELDSDTIKASSSSESVTENLEITPSFVFKCISYSSIFSYNYH